MCHSAPPKWPQLGNSLTNFPQRNTMKTVINVWIFACLTIFKGLHLSMINCLPMYVERNEIDKCAKSSDSEVYLPGAWIARVAGTKAEAATKLGSVKLWLRGSLIACISDCVHLYLCELLIVWIVDCVNLWLCEWLIVWIADMIAWIADCVNRWLCESLIACISGFSASLCELLIVWIADFVNRSRWSSELSFFKFVALAFCWTWVMFWLYWICMTPHTFLDGHHTRFMIIGGN